MSRMNRRSSILKNASSVPALNDDDGSKLNSSNGDELVINRRRSSMGMNRRVSFSSRVVVQVFQPDVDRPDLQAVRGKRVSIGGATEANDGSPAGAEPNRSAYLPDMEVESNSFYVTADFSRRSLLPNAANDLVQQSNYVLAQNDASMNMSLCGTTMIDENRNRDAAKELANSSDMVLSNETRQETLRDTTVRDRVSSVPIGGSNNRTQYEASMCISMADDSRMAQSGGTGNRGDMSDMELTTMDITLAARPPPNNASNAKAESLVPAIRQRTIVNESCMDISANKSDMDDSAMSMCTRVEKDETKFAVPTEPVRATLQKSIRDAGVAKLSNNSDMEISCMLERTHMVPPANVSVPGGMSADTKSMKDFSVAKSSNDSNMEMSCVADRTNVAPHATVNLTGNMPASVTASVIANVIANVSANVTAANANVSAKVPEPASVREEAPNESCMEISLMNDSSDKRKSVAKSDPSPSRQFPRAEISRPSIAPTPTSSRRPGEPPSAGTVYGRVSSSAVWSNESLLDLRRPVLESTALPTPTHRRFSNMLPITPRANDATATHGHVHERPVPIEEDEVPEKTRKLEELPTDSDAQAVVSSQPEVQQQVASGEAQGADDTYVLDDEPQADQAKPSSSANLSQLTASASQIPAAPSHSEPPVFAPQNETATLQQGSAKVVDWLFEKLSDSLRSLDAKANEDSDSDYELALDHDLVPVTYTAAPPAGDAERSANRSRLETSVAPANTTAFSNVTTTSRRRTMAKSALDVLATIRKSIVRAGNNATSADELSATRALDDSNAQIDPKNRRRTFTASRRMDDSEVSTSNKTRRGTLKDRLEELISRKKASRTVEELRYCYARFREFSASVAELGDLDTLSGITSYDTLIAAYRRAVTAQELRSICEILNNFYVPFVDKYADALRCIANAPVDIDISRVDDTASTIATLADGEIDLVDMERAIELFTKVHFASWKQRTLESVSQANDGDSVARFVSSRLNDVRTECAQLEDANLILRMRIDSLRRVRQEAASGKRETTSSQVRGSTHNHEADEATKAQIRKRIDDLQVRRDRYREEIETLSRTLEEARTRVLQLETDAKAGQSTNADRSEFRDAILNYENQYLVWRVDSLQRIDASRYAARLSLFERAVHVALSIVEQSGADDLTSRQTVEAVTSIGCSLTLDSALDVWPAEFLSHRKLYAQLLASMVTDLQRIAVPCDARHYCAQLSRLAISYQRLAVELSRISKFAVVSLPDSQKGDTDLFIDFCRKRSFKPKSSSHKSIFPSTSDALAKVIAYATQTPSEYLAQFRLVLKNFDLSAYAAFYWTALSSRSCKKTTDSSVKHMGFSKADFCVLTGEFFCSIPYFDELQSATERARGGIAKLLANEALSEAALCDHGLVFSLTDLVRSAV